MKNKKNVFYDKEADVLWIKIADGVEYDSEEISPWVTIEYVAGVDIIGVEVLHASRLFSVNVKGKQHHQLGKAVVNL